MFRPNRSKRKTAETVNRHKMKTTVPIGLKFCTVTHISIRKTTAQKNLEISNWFHWSFWQGTPISRFGIFGHFWPKKSKMVADFEIFWFYLQIFITPNLSAKFQVHMMTYQEVMGKNISKYEKSHRKDGFLPKPQPFWLKNRNSIKFFFI